ASAASFELENAEAVTGAVSEPEPVREPLGRLPVAAGAQADRACNRARHLELRDVAVRRDPADAVALRVPDVAIGAHGDVDRRAGLARDHEFGDLAVERDACDSIAVG